jgi:alpha-glucosidase
MLADDPQAYLQHPEAFKFIRQVPNRWDETRALKADLGKRVITIARRNGKNWFVGSMNGRIRNRFLMPLDFLAPARKYIAEIYEDGSISEVNGEAMTTHQRVVSSNDFILVNLAVGGGQAIRFREI